MNILFDLDGTLTDPREGILACFKYALDGLRIELPPNGILKAWIGPPLRESFGALLGLANKERIEQAVSLYRERFSSKGMYENVLYPGVRNVLAQLRSRGYVLFVATSKPRAFAQRIVDHFALREFFCGIHGSELDGTNADKTHLIMHVLKVECLLSSETVMVGDRVHDMVGARTNGIVPIGALWGFGSREELLAAGARTLCEKPAALVEVLSRLDRIVKPFPLLSSGEE